MEILGVAVNAATHDLQKLIAVIAVLLGVVQYPAVESIMFYLIFALFTCGWISNGLRVSLSASVKLRVSVDVASESERGRQDSSGQYSISM